VSLQFAFFAVGIIYICLALFQTNYLCNSNIRLKTNCFDNLTPLLGSQKWHPVCEKLGNQAYARGILINLKLHVFQTCWLLISEMRTFTAWNENLWN